MKKFTINSVLVLILFLLTTTNVSAQTTFTFGPMIIEKGGQTPVQPGTTFNNEIIRLHNGSQTTKHVRVIVKNVEPYGEEGKFKPIDEQLDSSISMQNWITLTENELDLAPESSTETRWKNFQFSINVPPNALPGVHYGALYFLPDSQNQELQPNQSAFLIKAEYVTAIIINVAGTIQDAGTISEFTTDHSFQEYGPINFTTQFTNSGNTFLKPKGQIAIKNMLGMTSETLPINQDEASIKRALPNLPRTYSNTWTNMFLAEDEKGNINADWGKWQSFRIGIYTATAELTYGYNQTPVTKSVTFIIFPWKLFLILLLTTLILTFLIRKYRKKNEERILRKYHQQTASQQQQQQNSYYPHPKNHHHS